MAPISTQKRAAWEAYVKAHAKQEKRTTEQFDLYRAAIIAEGIYLMDKNATSKRAASTASQKAQGAIRYLRQSSIDATTRRLYTAWQKSTAKSAEGSIGTRVSGQSPLYDTSQKTRGRAN